MNKRGVSNAPDSGTVEPLIRLAGLSPRVPSSGRASTYEERTGALIRRAALPDRLPAERLDRVWDRLERADRSWGPHGLASSPRWAVAVIVLLLSGGAVAAVAGVWTWPQTVVRGLIGRVSPVTAPRALGASASSPHPRLAAPEGAAVGPSPALLEDRPRTVLASPTSPLVSPPALPRPHAASVNRRPSVSPPADSPRAPAVADSTLTPAVTPASLPPRDLALDQPRDLALNEEGQLLARALAHLRQAHDPSSALGELDRYAQRFPSGVLAREARVARAEALLMAGRLPDARSVLVGLVLGADARDRELRLIRAELTVDSAPAAALDDFRAAWAASRIGAAGERALWGLAACHVRLGDDATARADLALYLAHFPDGSHAATARARLHD